MDPLVYSFRQQQAGRTKGNNRIDQVGNEWVMC
jgi:hypothetical protein